MSTLPVLLDDEYGYAVVDRETGQMVALTDASDRAIAQAAADLAEHDKHVFVLKRALAAEAHSRYGVGKSEAGGYAFTVTEATSWPAGAVGAALRKLVADGSVSAADAERCFPAKPTPSGVQIKALIGRLTVSDPEAAKLLANTATVSPPSLREVRAVAVDADVAA